MIPMNRREFAAVLGAGTGLALGHSLSAHEETERDRATAGPVRMHVGCQKGPTNSRQLQLFKRYGVDHICGYPSTSASDGAWTVDDLKRARDLCEQHGVALSMVALPFLTSSHIDREPRGAIMLGASPERDRDIEQIQKMIAACAQAGIPAFKYNMSLLGVVRTRRRPGRGGSSYSSWRLADAQDKDKLTRAGVVDADRFWERITYFLDRVIPVCEENKVRAACHPHDPGMPPTGYQGITRVLGTVEGLRKFVSIRESPYHGLNLCLGTTAEMLADPGRELIPVIREFGRRGKIFNIHFRNIRGRRDDFVETFPDEGDVDMLEAALALQEVGYDGMLMPDHMPTHPDDPGTHQAFAFGYGYIHATLRAVRAIVEGRPRPMP